MSQFKYWPDTKVVHKAAQVSKEGAVSALCKKGKAIYLPAETWTISNGAVTCPKCLKLLRAQVKKLSEELK